MSARYRVWCLSWEDTEDDGMEVVWYPALGPVPAPEKDTVYDWRVSDAKSAAEAYADFAHSHRDGYECSWPLTFRVRSPDGSTQDFEVERDFDPVFSARAVKPAKAPEPA